MNKNYKAQSTEQLQQENEELRLRLAESQATINAMRNMHEDTLAARGANPGKFLASSLGETSACLFFEKMNEGAFIISPKGKIITCNNHFAQLMNTVIEQIAGSDIGYFIAPAWHIKFNNLLNN